MGLGPLRAGAESGTGDVFDLREVAERNDEYSRFARRITFGITSFVFALFALGIGLLAGAIAHVEPERLTTLGAVLVALGGFLGYYGLGAFQSKGPTPRRLVVGPESLVLTDAPRSGPIEQRWDDPRLRVTIYDMRGFPTQSPSGRKRLSDFVLQIRNGPQTPIPSVAFESIMSQAEKHHLAIVGDPNPPEPIEGFNRIVLKGRYRRGRPGV